MRQGWEKAFQAMTENKDDELLDEEALLNQSNWDLEEWDW